jgi:hypothetical protein
MFSRPERAYQFAACFLVLIALIGCAGMGGRTGERTDKDRFAEADANHDGILDRNEVSDYIVIQIFDSRDANHDGRMTEQEWTGGDASRLAGFKKRDVNHDGVVTKEEAIQYGRAHGQAKEIMREADKNHDGVLSREEAREYVGSREGPPG